MRWLTALAALIVFGSVATAAEKTPRIIECTAESVILHPAGTPVSWAELQSPSNAVVQLLNEVTANSATQNLLVLVRPGSVKFYRMMCRLAGQRLIDVIYDVVDTNEVILLRKKPNHAPPPMSKTAAFVECRNKQIFVIDKDGIDQQVARALSALSGRGKMPDFLKEISKQDIGDKFYRVLPNYLLSAVVALEPRGVATGDSMEDLPRADSMYSTTLSRLDTQKYYIVFLVRDDSFPVFRRARELAEQNHFDVFWELLSIDEPIKFGRGGPVIFDH